MKNLVCLLPYLLIAFTTTVNAQWVEQTLPGDIVVTLGIDFSNQNHGITGGWAGDLSTQIFGETYYTTNGGTTWIEARLPDSMRVMVDLQMIDDMKAYGAGAYNQTFINNQSSSNFTPMNNPHLQSRYERLGMNSSRQEEYRGYFVETTDGGLTWHPKGSFEDSVYYLVGIFFIDEQTGFVLASGPGGSSRAILKTTDGGNNWYYVFPFIEQLWIEDIKFVDNLNGIAVGEITVNPGTGVIFKTSDGGENWDPLLNPGLSSIFSVAYPNLYTIIIGGANSSSQSAVYKTTDGGINWQQINLYTGPDFLQGVDAVLNSNFILIYGTYFSSTQIPFIDISSDGGNNWHYSQFPQYENYIPLYSKIVDDTRWYITGSNNIDSGFVLFTDNSGGVPVELTSFTVNISEHKVSLSWSTATELNNQGFEIERSFDKTTWPTIGFKEGKGTTTEPQNYSYFDDISDISSEKLSYRLKQIDFDGSFEYSDIVEVEIAPRNFSLEQNYPNPFNPSTKIIWQTPVGSWQNLKVFDVLGREVETLVDEYRDAGNYEVEFSPSSINHYTSSGVYFYQLKAGSFVETKKMSLVK